MFEDNIDFDSWGKKGKKENDKVKHGSEKEKKNATREPRERRSNSSRRVSRGTSYKSSGRNNKIEVKKRVPIESIPIDAFRGIFFFIMGKNDKKLNKKELKLALKKILSSREKFDELIQNIIDAIYS
ncbi:MAG: hypothetical protein ACTSVI_09550 [Promethearchaeota archaeon]